MCSEKTKGININAFNIITNKNEAKTMEKHISYHCKCKSNNTTCNSNQKWNNETCQCVCKNYCTCKEDYRWNPSTCACEDDKYFKNVADISMITCDQIISAMDIASTKMTNTMAKNRTLILKRPKSKRLSF